MVINLVLARHEMLVLIILKVIPLFDK